jgi:hypothetical protein
MAFTGTTFGASDNRKPSLVPPGTASSGPLVPPGTPGGGNVYNPNQQTAGRSYNTFGGIGGRGGIGQNLVGGFKAPAPPPPPSPSGSQSGPGILENWFNQRANGTDPAYEYATKRGMEQLGTASAARGGFNSGAARQQESDFMANMGAQRTGQLDALAGGASGEHQNRLNSMFNQGQALAGGQSGINSAYDLAAGKSMSDALSALLGFTTNKAGVDSKSNQQGLSNLISLGGLI